MDAPSANGDLRLLDGVSWRGAVVPGERSHDLLALLALSAPHTVADARLLEDVWAEHAPPSSTKALQVLVSRVRSGTDAAVVERSGHGYRLGHVDVDYLSLCRHTEAARAASDAGDPASACREARAALATTLAEPGTTDRGPLAELRSAARRELDLAREVLGRALSALGEHAEALALLEPAVARRPDDEALLEALLRSEAAVLGAPTALARYERHREQVRDSLGTDPGPALQRLHAELLARDSPVRKGLHHDATRLIGRDADVTALRATLASSRVVSIVGAGGLGKTRLAHLIGRLAEQPVVHFVELAGVASPDGVAVEVGSVLGVRETVSGRRLHGAARTRDLHIRILEQVGAAPALLILDNCEHVVEAVADLVAVLVARAPMLRVLTTSRAPLGLAAERVYPLPQLGRQDAVELFRERATAARPGVRLEEARVASLVDRLDGLPLAVELAAARVRVMTVEEIERRLEDRFALLRGGSRDAPERHQTLLAVIDWSWNLLDDQQRVALRRLSLFRDGFSLDGAASVIGVDDAVPVVSELVDQSLVAVNEDDHAGMRYRLLETVREFGRLQLAEAGDEAAAETRLRSWAIGLADELLGRLFSRDQVASMAAVRVEEGNLVDALRSALTDRDAPCVVALMALLSTFWSVEGSHLKVVNVASEVEDVVCDADLPLDREDALRIVLGALLVNTLIFAGEPAARALEKLRVLGPGDGDPRVAATTTVLLALADGFVSGEADALEKLYDAPDRLVALATRQWASQSRENAGDIPGAFKATEDGLALWEEDDGPWTRAMLTAQLSVLATQQGDVDAARSYAERALPDMERLGAVEDSIQLKALLAVCDMTAGRLEEAERVLAEIDQDARTHSILGGLMILLCGNAELALARGDVERGLILYRDAVVALKARSIPGVDVATDLTPWVLFPEAGALAAHARHRSPDGAALFDDLLSKQAVVLAGGRGLLDYPMTGAVLFALGLWQVMLDDRPPGDLRAGIRMLVLADAFAYNRLLPSLSWEAATEVADQRLPGGVVETRAEVAGLSAAELRADAERLVAELAR
jgi:predicted ATPase/DNA-binding SARP family transcriptional activator